MVPVIDIGSYAKYPKTGTFGTVVRFQEQHGQTFVELDSTHLLYRIDQLIPASFEEQATIDSKDKEIKKIVYEREDLGESAFNDAAFQQDGACHGGG